MEATTNSRAHSNRVLAVCFALLAFSLTGCPQNPYLAPTNSPLWQQQQQPQLSAQLTELQRRVQLLDDNNRQLHTQLAQSEQQAQVYRGELDVVRQQLAATVRDLESSRLASTDAQQKLQSMQANAAPRGNATLAANTSLRRIAETANLGGLKIEYEGDVARIRIPADQLFQPGTAQLLPSSAAALDPLVAAIPQAFSRQRIAIEGYTDDRPTYGGVFASAHQLTGAQAMAVFDYLTKRGGLPQQQLFVLAQGANYPRTSNETAPGREANRRIEVVIYPETF